MTWLRLVHVELRKISTTKLPWGFLAVLVLVAGLNGSVVIWGTDMDGSKTFISTALDQQSLMAFAANAMIGTSLFGAIAVAEKIRPQHRGPDVPDLPPPVPRGTGAVHRDHDRGRAAGPRAGRPS